ncbi:helix-turn-helix domain-containing protein [Rhodococcus hoagii]|nr:helix-turn-helix domain-containing protein [Prescottella equi]
MATFIKAHRNKLGLTQVQLAAAASISDSYVTKLERGSNRTPSEPVLDQLSAVFELDSDAQRILYMLAGKSRSDSAPPVQTDTPLNRRLYGSMADGQHTRMMVVGPHLNLMTANEKCVASFPGIDEYATPAEWLFFDSRARLVHEHWEKEARSAVWWLRGAVADDAGHAGLGDQLDRLNESSSFRRLWADPTTDLRPADTMRIRDYQTREVITLISAYYRRFPAGDDYVWVGVPIGS